MILVKVDMVKVVSAHTTLPPNYMYKSFSDISYSGIYNMNVSVYQQQTKITIPLCAKLTTPTIVLN